MQVPRRRPAVAASVRRRVPVRPSHIFHKAVQLFGSLQWGPALFVMRMIGIGMIEEEEESSDFHWWW